MGVLSESCGTMDRTYFFRSLGEGRGVAFTAAVVQRRIESLWKSSPIDVRGFFPALLRPRRPASMAVPGIEQSSAWTSTSNFGGPTEACFSDERRILRVAGEDFEVPVDPRTFVVLVDEVAGVPLGRRICTTLVAVPLRPESDRSMLGRKEYGEARINWMRENQRVWREAVDADNTVRTFLDRREDDGSV